MRLLVLAAVFAAAYGQPLWFEPNQGQVHPSVQFLAHTPGGYVYFAHDKMAVRDIRMDLVGANKHATVVLEEPTGGISSYFIGRSEKDWHTGIPHYGRMWYKNVYSGIDLVYYASGHDIEYDFVLKPGADPNQIKLAYNKAVQIDSNGDLLVAGLKQRRPKVLQNGREIECDYLVRGERVQLALAHFDHSQPLTVDPVLEFSTYLGGPGDESILDVKLDASVLIYAAGGTQSPQAPSLNPFQQSQTQTLTPFVLKMTNDGQRVVFFAEIGGNGWDNAYGIAVDSSGVIIDGRTRSANFPVKNAFQSDFKAVWDNAFLSKLTTDGKSLIFSTYYGGSNWEIPTAGMAMDSQGNVWLSGYTESKDLPLRNAAQSMLGGPMDCFLAKFSGAGTLLVSTYWGGSALDACWGIAVDAGDNIYAGGLAVSVDFPLHNAIQTTRTPRTGFGSPFLAKFTATGQVVFSTFLGDGASGGLSGITFDSGGNIYVAGEIDDPNLVTTTNAFQRTAGSNTDAFVIKLDPGASKILYSSYLGGSSADAAHDIKVDANGNIYVYGYTGSADFPIKDSLQSFRGGGVCQCDLFIAKFTPSGNSLVYSTLLGGTGHELATKIALDSSNTVYLVGVTSSPNFPVVKAYQPSPGGGYDGFLAKISDSTPVAPSTLTPSPGRLLFRYTQGQTIPAAQSITIAGGAFTVMSPVPWLSVSTSGTTLSVNPNPAALAPGSYTTSLSLLPSSGTPASVDITLTVLAAAPVLTSADPSFIPINSDPTTVTFHGSGFTKDTIVFLYSVSFTPVQFVNSSTLRITLPANDLNGTNNFVFTVKNTDSDVSNPVSVAIGVPAPQITAVVNAASFATGPVAPGEIVTIFGTNLDQNVTFDFVPATMIYSSATQVNVTVPYGVTGPTTSVQSGSSAPFKLDVAPSAPGIFAAVPAGANIFTLYGTGCGALTNDDLPRCALSVSVIVNDQPAIVLYAGIAPGLVQGVNQINIQLPDGITSGQLTIVLTAGDTSSKRFMWNQP
jgi:uncharacterized protein (TIGR03437 family)